MFIVVGSEALKYHGINLRAPNDVDIWGTTTYPFLTFGGKRTECFLAPQELIGLVPTKGYYATPDAVYTIKCSHAVYDIKWQKTKRDIIRLKGMGCTLIPDLYEYLVSYWEGFHGNKDFLSLNKNKEDFFTDAVEYLYDHDYLHELVAHPNEPMYTRCLKEGQEVLIDKDKFFSIPFEDKVRMFREEIAVIAAERWLLNPKTSDKVSLIEAHQMSLRKTVTSLTKGWASSFIVENLEYFYKLDVSYLDFLLKTLKSKEEKVDMSKKTVDLEFFINQLNNHFVDIDFDVEGDISWFILEFLDCVVSSTYYREKYPSFSEFVSNNNISVLEAETGGEGEGEHCYIVFSWGDKIYKHEFAYYSYHGNEFYSDTFTEVTPKEKTITVYE